MAESIFEQKREKYLQLREAGQFRDHYGKTQSVEQVRSKSEGEEGLSTAGRIVLKRKMGKVIFAQLFDFTGTVQIYLQKSPEAPEEFKEFADSVAVGDFVGVAGSLFRTKTGELTLHVDSWSLLNKCLRTLPEKFHGMEDQESIYRKRYLDLVTNPDSRRVFQKRSQVVTSLRKSLEEEGFLEVETPILQNQASGALARPFHTHHNALGVDCVLRIAPETYLKRCIGGGMDKVYEFARCFRNEGISQTHLQDFTMLEFYAAYWNSKSMRAYVERMIKTLVQDVFATKSVTLQGHEVSFEGDWPVIEFAQLVKQDCGIDLVEDAKDVLTLQKRLQEKDIRLEVEPNASWATLADTLYKKVSRPKLVNPCFIVKYPAEMAPLARRNQDDPRFVDLFQFVVAGVELVKAYSELVDPVDQRERFEAQAAARAKGDEESMEMDEDFLMAMEHGFPPIAGVGIGIDRLTMVLCGCENIKDAVLFPLMRPLSGSEAQGSDETGATP